MNYLITGSKGQLGREWTDFLQKKGIAHTSYGSKELDITDDYAVKEKISQDKPDIIINCAAYTKVDDAEIERDKAFSVNEMGVKVLSEHAESLGAKLVHYSTDYVFAGNREDREKHKGGYDENAPIKPVNIYGKSKRAGEVVLERKNNNHLIIRISWLCGRYGNNFVKTMLSLAKKNKELKVVNDQIGSPSFAFDVVEKTWQLLQMDKKGVFHISSKGAISWADLAKETFRITSIKTDVNPISTDEYPTAARRPSYSVLSTKKIENAGLNPISWQDGLSKLLNQLNS